MTIDKSFYWVLYGVVSILLIWSAYSDYKTRTVPRVAGLGIWAIGLIYLLIHQNWICAGYYIFITLVSGVRRNIYGQILIIVVTFIVLVLANNQSDLIIGLLFTTVLYQAGIFSGGDAQIAFALFAFSQNLLIIYFLFLPDMILAIVLNLKRFGVKGAINRARTILNNFRTLNSPSQDPDAIWFPWIVLATPGALIYIWLYPGIAIK